jgi:hypothetical protein
MFEFIVQAAMVVIGLCLLASLVLIIRTKNEFIRAVVSDMVFYSMVSFYLLWTIGNDTQISYEIVLLAALVGGVLPTMSIARIISKGRR